MNKKYYQKHKAEILARQKLYYETHKEQAKEYYSRNKEKLIKQSLDYYFKNKERISEFRRQHIIKYGGLNKRIKVDKPLYPADGKCLICNKLRGLEFHHWEDNNPSDGMWICPGCHKKIHANLRRYSKHIVRQLLNTSLKRGMKEVERIL